MTCDRTASTGTFTRRGVCTSLGALGLGLLTPGGGRTAPGGRRLLKVALGRVGNVEVARVHETTTYFKATTWFPDLRPEALEPYLTWLAPDFYNPASGIFPMPIQTWILRSAGKIIVVDTCYGNDKNRPGFKDAHMLGTNYLDRLAAVGIRPQDVDFVLCTHLHLDHVGWNTRWESGRWVPTFPNAKYLWSVADQRDSLHQAEESNPFPFTRDVYADSVLPIIEAGLARPVEGAFALDEHIVLRPAPGHSPGCMRIEVRSRGRVAVLCGDMLHSPLQIPLWKIGSAGDIDRVKAAEARRELLEFCVEEKALLIPGHFSAPHVAFIERSNGGYIPRFGWT